MDEKIPIKGKAYSIIPEWILYSDIGDGAVRLFAILGRYVGSNEAAWPSRKTLAGRMGCSLSTLDRSIQELKNVGAVKVEHQNRKDGSLTSSLFYLWPFDDTPSHERRGVDQQETAPTPNIDIAIKNINEGTTKNHSFTRTPTGAEKWTEETKELTALLCNWNVKNGYKPFTLGPKQWANMDKLLRINQYTPDEVRAVIEWCQKDAFWNGNIRSTMKLRQKFDTLLGRMRQEGIGVPASSGAVLSPEQKNIALIYDLYDQGEEWYDDTTGEFVLANPASLCYTRPRDAQGNLVDAEGKPYKLTSQGQRQRVEA